MRRRDRLFVSVAGRVTLFLFLFNVLIIFLYVLGSFQSFTDDSLIKLLTLYKYSALVYIALSLSYIFILITAGRDTGRKLGRRITVTGAGIVVTTAVFLIVEIIMAGLEPV